MRDVLIVGAGIAGSYLAWKLGELGYEVAVFEREIKTKDDSGIVSLFIERFLKLPRKLIFQRIKEFRFLIGKRSISLRSKRPFALLVDSKRLRELLRERAKANAELRYLPVRAVGQKRDGVAVLAGKRWFKGKLLLGCDGACSLVARSFGLWGKRELYQAAFYRTSRLNGEGIDVILDKSISKSFFGWRIEKRGEIGVIRKANANLALRELARRFSIRFDAKKASISPIAIGSCKPARGRAILVGEAALQTKPLTGGGIVFSLLGASLALRFVKSYLDGEVKLSDATKRYESECRRVFQNEIKAQYALRKLYSCLPWQAINFLASILPRGVCVNELTYDRVLSLFKLLPD